VTPLDAQPFADSRLLGAVPSFIEVAPVLTPERYAEMTLLTAHYPGVGTGDHAELAYLGLGLGNEAGALLGKMAGRFSLNSVPGEMVPEIIDGIGEVYWYTARLAAALFGSPAWALETIPHRKYQPTSTMLGLELSHQCGLASGAVSRLLRGDPNPDDLRHQAILSCREISIRLAWLAEYYGGSQQIAMERNFAKRLPRHLRSAVNGPGDRQ